MILSAKIKLFFKSITTGILGIAAEMLTTAIFILAGLLICLFWWGLIAR